MAWLLLLFVLASSSDAQTLTQIPSKLDQVVYLYPNQVREERQLAECETGEVCSTHHERYWLLPWVRRYCRCPTTDCSETVAMLDNRSHIKLCRSEKESIEPCTRNEVGLEERKEEGKRDITKISCRCSYPAYWALVSHVENKTLVHDKYACQPMKECKKDNFCGHIRGDTYSMYMQCKCPQEYICLNRDGDRTQRNVSEALFFGPALRAYCQRYTHSTQSQPTQHL